MEKKVEAHVIVTGKVQGVFFRAETQRIAEQHHVRGWVRNCPNRSVEALFQGDGSSVQQVIAWCRKGPARSVVTDVSVTFQEPEKVFDRFEIRY